ncbi:alpha-L-fucosidase [Chthonomonas calidirosea]|uniref:alpha-L-fucosidase n=1 Tax=Chthonomonas calidirosea TaxID=454171 RepID=UPI0006ECB3CC|nr:alpha-L-fucosidase [Chthonomonas calidirosea]CEK14413.1 alpha-L-fucosidase [Chthonomonas calidirosea]
MWSKRTKRLVFCAVTGACITIGSRLLAQSWPDLMVNPETHETKAQFAKRTAWWREAKFGMFIHWGIYAVPADSSQGAAEWYFYNHTTIDPATGKPRHLQVAEYEKFAKQFDPVKFNAEQWVSIAKRAGMRYIVITSKHHDGFCMFRTRLTSYNIVDATPYHHDPMADLARACREQGLHFGFYYSFMDWHAPDYLPRRPWDTRPTEGASLERYVEYVKGQLRELLTQYGPISVLWFDGGWEHTAQEEHALEIVQLIRSLQPNIIINDRLNLPEDYSTPEQTIPSAPLPNGRLWETCMTINNTWGYSKNDTDFKSATQLIRDLCLIVGRGGNFLLNVGPTAEGIIPQPEVDRLLAIGDWLRVNGASIYGTEAGPFRRLPFDGSCTKKGNRLYLQVFNWPQDGVLRLPDLKTRVLEARCLLNNQRLPVTAGADGVMIGKPDRLDPAATVIALKLAGAPEVENVPIVEKPGGDGRFWLPATDADIHGEHAQLETKGGQPNIGYWTDVHDTVSWLLKVPQSGDYEVRLIYACEPASAGSTFQVVVASKDAPESRLSGEVTATGGWDDFRSMALEGHLHLQAGVVTLKVIPITMPHGAVMNLRAIELIPQS